MYLFIFAVSPASWCKCASLDLIIIHIYRQSDPKREFSLILKYLKQVIKQKLKI